MAAILNTTKRYASVPASQSVIRFGGQIVNRTEVKPTFCTETYNLNAEDFKPASQKFDEVKDLYATDKEEYFRRSKPLIAQLDALAK